MGTYCTFLATPSSIKRTLITNINPNIASTHERSALWRLVLLKRGAYFQNPLSCGLTRERCVRSNRTIYPIWYKMHLRTESKRVLACVRHVLFLRKLFNDQYHDFEELEWEPRGTCGWVTLGPQLTYADIEFELANNRFGAGLVKKSRLIWQQINEDICSCPYSQYFHYMESKY